MCQLTFYFSCAKQQLHFHSKPTEWFFLLIMLLLLREGFVLCVFAFYTTQLPQLVNYFDQFFFLNKDCKVFHLDFNNTIISTLCQTKMHRWIKQCNIYGVALTMHNDLVLRTSTWGNRAYCCDSVYIIRGGGRLQSEHVCELLTFLLNTATREINKNNKTKLVIQIPTLKKNNNLNEHKQKSWKGFPRD